MYVKQLYPIGLQMLYVTNLYCVCVWVDNVYACTMIVVSSVLVHCHVALLFNFAFRLPLPLRLVYYRVLVYSQC